MDWVALGSLATAAGSLATAVAVLFTREQLRLSRDQATSSFEDQLEREYREIIAQIPVGVLLGEPLAEPESKEALVVFYRYIDLTNQQVFLRREDRIRDATWTSWREGIAHQLNRPAFRAAWERIKDAVPEDFHELRRLEQSGFTEDPRHWSGQPAVAGGGPASSSQPMSEAA